MNTHLVYFNAFGGLYDHRCKLYGGSSDSTTGIGAWDSTASQPIWQYISTTQSFLITPQVRARKFIQIGFVSITPTASNTNTTKKVTFDEAFPGTPYVFTNPNTGAPSSVHTSANEISSTGFTMNLTRSGATETGIYWVAIYAY